MNKVSNKENIYLGFEPIPACHVVNVNYKTYIYIYVTG